MMLSWMSVDTKSHLAADSCHLEWGRGLGGRVVLTVGGKKKEKKTNKQNPKPCLIVGARNRCDPVSTESQWLPRGNVIGGIFEAIRDRMRQSGLRHLSLPSSPSSSSSSPSSKTGSHAAHPGLKLSTEPRIILERLADSPASSSPVLDCRQCTSFGLSGI